MVLVNRLTVVKINISKFKHFENDYFKTLYNIQGYKKVQMNFGRAINGEKIPDYLSRCKTSVM
jgi:hypothetical protein